ncbi:MAG: rhodanese-like domain-containing protein [Gammaproteobacteria bacterium]|nr:rhodanese-like domain-containing protein [Gammaproteobacteria bacterium]MDX5374381.1 rhodanese-like domain-containing protein [Gammaproteobacteria bacterium]
MDNVSPKGLSPRHAWQLVQENPRALLIDIRSNMEHLFIGHPVGSVHIPWIDEPDWTVNPHFVTEVRKLLLGGIACHGEGCAPIVLICRSGKRSIEAGEALIRAGFGEVYYVEEGFEGELDAQHHRSTSGGWRFHGLPWEQC